MGSRRLLAALLHTPSTGSSHSCSRGYGRPDLRSLLLHSVLQGWVAFAQTSKLRAERALRACLALRARRKKMILKVVRMFAFHVCMLKHVDMYVCMYVCMWAVFVLCAGEGGLGRTGGAPAATGQVGQRRHHSTGCS